MINKLKWKAPRTIVPYELLLDFKGTEEIHLRIWTDALEFMCLIFIFIPK